jgi:multicomponent Na+:H+ antiporter subunit F
MGRPDFLDIAIVYALISFISVIGVLHFSDSAVFKQDPQDTGSTKEKS